MLSTDTNFLQEVSLGCLGEKSHFEYEDTVPGSYMPGRDGPDRGGIEVDQIEVHQIEVDQIEVDQR